MIQLSVRRGLQNVDSVTGTATGVGLFGLADRPTIRARATGLPGLRRATDTLTGASR